MQLRNILKWNTRASLVYAFGVWTMIGTYGYYTYTGAYDVKPENKTEGEEEVKEELPNPNQEVHQSAHVKTTIVYKDNFVPYTTRIYNLVNNYSGDSASESKDTRKNDFEE